MTKKPKVSECCGINTRVGMMGDILVCNEYDVLEGGHIETREYDLSSLRIKKEEAEKHE